MAAVIDIIEGLTILNALYPGASVESGHDVIWCEGPQPKHIDESIVQTLYDAGWRWDNENDCWRHFT